MHSALHIPQSTHLDIILLMARFSIDSLVALYSTLSSISIISVGISLINSGVLIFVSSSSSKLSCLEPHKGHTHVLGTSLTFISSLLLSSIYPHILHLYLTFIN